jgi:hypothetical protein
MAWEVVETMTLGERFFAGKLIDTILAHGFSVSVNDGEEWTLNRSVDARLILCALATTDEDHVRAYDATGKSQGTFSLIWGNDPSGEELIADHTDNRVCNRIWQEVMGYPIEDQLELGEM